MEGYCCFVLFCFVLFFFGFTCAATQGGNVSPVPPPPVPLPVSPYLSSKRIALTDYMLFT